MKQWKEKCYSLRILQLKMLINPREEGPSPPMFYLLDQNLVFPININEMYIWAAQAAQNIFCFFLLIQ